MKSPGLEIKKDNIIISANDNISLKLLDYAKPLIGAVVLIYLANLVKDIIMEKNAVQINLEKEKHRHEEKVLEMLIEKEESR